jgi:dextranase
MDKKFPFLLTCFSMIAGVCAAQFPFYFSSGNFLPPHSWNQADAVRMSTVANTNIQIANATALDSCYFRFYSALNGGTNYESNLDTDVRIPLSTPFNLQVANSDTDYGKSFFFISGSLSDNFVFKTNGSGAPGNAQCAVIRVQGPIQSVTSISQYPDAIVSPGQDVTITAFISDTFSPGQGVYLRYTTDYWASSTVVEMTGSGTQYSGIIPASVNMDNASLNYYVFTSGDSLTIAPDEADLMTINLYNNNFQNFSYIVSCQFTLGNAYFQMVNSNKARYNPGDTVWLIASFNDSISGNLSIQYWHLGDSVYQQTFSLNNVGQYSWFWIPPAKDTTGYLVQINLLQGGIVSDSTSIAIDVSSGWTKFPRYGFLSKYDYTFTSDRAALFAKLNRYHLNALQFYDVNYKHHLPLAGSVNLPDTLWPDIANRQTYLETVKAYINLAHTCNMLAMDYNLIYGADYPSCDSDGVSPQSGLYSDMAHQDAISYGNFPNTWASTSILVENPADTGWQNYILANELNLFRAIPYDGWHVDQLGSQGSVYTYDGTEVDLGNSFGPFLKLAKQELGVKLCMNAVTNYGQPSIATAPVDVLYTEVWPPYTGYNDLVHLIDTNATLSNSSLATVLAAYMDQNSSDTIGIFNTPAVLLTDAVIFAAGGSHIEMGEHLLDNPYFPNNNLNMSCELQASLVHYYDFLVAYENLLRDSVSASATSLQTTGKQTLSNTAATGSIWVMSTQKPNQQIFNLINLVSANTLNWNDPKDNQSPPTVVQNLQLSFQISGYVTQLFAASPDWNNGVPVALAFTQHDSVISFTLPALNYWSMIVAT